VIAAVFVLVLAIGAIVAGAGYARKARAMAGFQMTTGRVLARDVVAITGDRTEGRWGDGGGWTPRVTYAYSVDGEDLTGDRVAYAPSGLKRSVAERRAAAYPDEVLVWYDPADPRDAYLERHTPRIGRVLVAGGVVAAAGAIAAIAASL
jgi:hypothetical protein